MVWKPKEKGLTRDEAIDLAKKELRPYWFRTEPLIAGVTRGKSASLYPLDKSFNETSWLVHIIDPTVFSGINLIHYAVEWNKRYDDYSVRTLLVLSPVYKFIVKGDAIRTFLDRRNIDFPVAVDFDEVISKAFDVKDLPKTVLLDNNKRLIEVSGKINFPDTETIIQKFLRRKDPGLPLHPVYVPEKSLPFQVAKVEFGKNKGAKLINAKVDEMDQREELLPQDIPPLSIFLGGKWQQDAESLRTNQGDTFLGIRLPGPDLSIVGETLGASADYAKMIVEINDRPVLDIFAGRDLVYDDTGKSYVPLRTGAVYQVLTGLPEDSRDVMFRFPNAAKTPISLYGIRVTE